MTAARYMPGASLLSDGRVLIGGGYKSSQLDLCPASCLNSAEIYDPATGTFSATGNLVSGRGGAVGTLLPSGQVLVTGGLGGRSAEVWASGTFHATAGKMVHSHYGDIIAVLLPNGRVLIVADGTAELYQP